jgi:hypothetical protein
MHTLQHAHLWQHLPPDPDAALQPLAFNYVSDTTGLAQGDGDEALLGQAFLRHFNARIETDHMFIQPR